MVVLITVLIYWNALIYGIDPDLMLAIARTESSMNPDVVAKEAKGGKSYGLFQIRGKTATDLGYTGNRADLISIDINIELASIYINKCQQKYGKSLESITCCYNAGLYRKDATCKSGQVRAYQKKVRKYYVKGT